MRSSTRWALPALLTGLVVLTGLAGCAARNRGPVAPRDDAAGVERQRVVVQEGPRLLRIGLATDADALTLESDVPCLLLAGVERRRAARLEPGVRLRLEPDGGAVIWRAGRRTGRAARHLFVQPVDPAGTVVWEDVPYPGELRADARDGRLTLVNAVELETYLRGVVPWEIGRPGPEGQAALAAQAVAARTYSVSHLGEREALGFDMWSTVTDQVYRGLHGVDAQCDLAIEETAGLVLRHGGREIDAYYSSTCGGVSSGIDAVWPRPAQPYLISRPDSERGGAPFCAGSSHFAWSTAWSVGDMQRLLAATLPEYLNWYDASPARQRWAGEAFRPARSGADPRSPGRLLDLRVTRRTPSGRVAALEIVAEAGVYTIRGDRVRWVLAPVEGRFSILKSAWFDLEIRRDGDGRPERIEASGRGFGHGIGLCQTGALGMARLGYDFRRILAHYYPGARLERVWSR